MSTIAASGIKGGDLVHFGDQVLIDRLQSAGPDSVNTNVERIYELGRYLTLATTREVTDISFTMESIDASYELEDIITGGVAADVTVALTTTEDSNVITFPAGALTSKHVGYAVVVAGAGNADKPGENDLYAEVLEVLSATTARVNHAATDAVTDPAGVLRQVRYDLSLARPFNVLGQYKAGQKTENPFDVVATAIVPFLLANRVEYRLGLDDNAAQTVTLSGDSIYYTEGTGQEERFTATGNPGQTLALTHPVIAYVDDPINDVKYASSVHLRGAGERLFLGADYTETATGAGDAKTVTITLTRAVPAGETIVVAYPSTDPVEVPVSLQAAVDVTRPAAVKGRNIEVLLGGVNITDRLSRVQSATASWGMTTSQIKEFGNQNAVGQDAEPPTVDGTVTLKVLNQGELKRALNRATGKDPDFKGVLGVNSNAPLDLTFVLYSPEKDAQGKRVALKAIRIPDARTSFPSLVGRVNETQSIDLNFSSDSGVIYVYRGARP